MCVNYLARAPGQCVGQLLWLARVESAQPVAGVWTLSLVVGRRRKRKEGPKMGAQSFAPPFLALSLACQPDSGATGLELAELEPTGHGRVVANEFPFTVRSTADSGAEGAHPGRFRRSARAPGVACSMVKLATGQAARGINLADWSVPQTQDRPPGPADHHPLPSGRRLTSSLLKMERPLSPNRSW